MPSITCSDLSFAWPDGGVVFDGLSFALGEGRAALVGRNGVGKSTLLRLIAGELAPTRGSVQVSGRLAYLQQDVALAVDRRVDEVLGIAEARAALLLAELAPQLLLLDEPTNNLDLSSVRQLTTALASYRGAMMVASHDVPFLREAGVTRWLRLERRLTEIDPL
jgi:ATPase subunit of ABC transporter with duplicated ATPase domains